MRFVAVALAILTLPLLTVQAAEDHDECGTLTHEKPCHDLAVASPSSSAPLSKRYFLWLGVAKCANPQGDSCRGTPNPEHAPPKGPDGKDLPVSYPYNAVAGILYEDTNGYPGLQRFELRLSETIKYAPDRMVLI